MKMMRKIWILGLLLLLLPVLPAAAAEDLGITVTASPETVTAGEEFTLTVALENNPGSIRGVQVDIGGIDGEKVQLVEEKSLLPETAGVLSNAASYQSEEKTARLLYVDEDGTLPATTKDIFKATLKADESLTGKGKLTLPVKVMAQTETEILLETTGNVYYETVAKITDQDGTVKYYRSLAEALEDAKKAAEPATIILLADDTVEQNVDFVVTIEKNGHTANIKADTEKGYKLVENAEKYEVVEESAKLFEIDFVSMVLQNSLMMRFAFPADSVADWTGAYAVATKTYADGSANVEQIVPFAEWLTADINGVKHYHFAFDKIAGKEMTDNIYVVIYNAAGEAISEEYVESVRSYVMRTLNNPVNSDKKELLTMMVDMLNYGAAAQESFNYAKNDLANNELTQEQKAMSSAVLAPCADNRIKGENYQGSRLMLEESIKFQMGFAGLTEEMYAEIKFTNHYGEAQSDTVAPEKMEASGTVVIEINQIVVADARSLVRVTVYNSDGTVYGSATDSVESYVARMTNSNDPLYEMIMKFADSAYAYMH